MTTLGQNFSLVRGDDDIVVIMVKGGDGALLPLTGASARWSYSRKEGGPTIGVKTEADDLDIYEAEGAVAVNFQTDETAEYDLGDFRHELEVTIDGVVHTVEKGRMTVKPDMQEPA